MIRVLIVDDHQAIRAGLVALLRQEPGFVPTATAANAEQALARAAESAVDVALLDHHLPDGSGVELCRRLRGSPRAVLYTAVSLDLVVVPALVAGAAGVVAKSAPTEELFEALRAATRGEASFPPVSRHVMTAAAAHLDEEDLPILGMAMDHTPSDEMASALRISRDELERRIDGVLESLGAFARSA